MNKVILITVFMLSLTAVAFAGQDRPRIRELKFRGNRAYPAKTLKRQIISRKTSFLRKRYFYREVLSEDIQRLLLFYNKNGYLNADVEADIDEDKENNTVDISLNISEGERFTVSSLMFLGNEFYEDEKLQEHSQIKLFDYFSKSAMEKTVSRILSLYTDNGFSEMEIDTDLNINYMFNTVEIDFFITERERHTIAGIKIKGNEKTQENVIRRKLTFKRGEYLNFSSLLESRQRLLRTGLFTSVFINSAKTQTPSGENKKDVIIEVSERDSIQLGASAGYDTVESFWQKLEISNRNLRGSSRKAGVTLRRSEIQRSAEAFFSSPWTFGGPVNVDFRASTEYKKEPSYEVTESGVGISAGKTFTDTIKASLSYDYKISHFNNIDPVRGQKNRFEKNIIALESTYDSRDSFIYPTKGTYISLKNELALGDLDFFRTSADTRFYYSISGRLIAASALRTGAIFSSMGSSRLPPNERLYSGGPYTVRGFKYKSLGPLDSKNTPLGGKAEIVWNIAELRLNIYKSVGILAFADAGNIWESIYEIDLSQIRTSAGGGLMMTLPFGVFRLEYGFNLDRQEGEERGIFFFGSGTAF
ncbi:MAG: outer membrane protein assembly factor BamA [Elusimicrobiota bacterium]